MHKTRYDHLFMFGFGALLLSACTSLAQVQNKPDIPYMDWGACPYECCMYGDWVATVPVNVLRSRDANGRIAFRLQAGEKITAIDGVAITRKVGVSKIIKPVDFRLLSLKPGDVYFTLHDMGEGEQLFWYRGETYTGGFDVPEGSVEVLSNPEYDWWVEIENKDGEKGWLLEPNAFEGQDECG